MIYFYLSLVTYVFFLIIKYRESFYYLKKEKYDTKKYGKLIKDKTFTIDLLSLIIILVAIYQNIKVIAVAMLIVYMILFLYNLKKNNKTLKLNKKDIPRIVLIVILFIGLNIWFILDYISYHQGLYVDNNALYYIVLSIVGCLTYPITFISNIISRSFDKKR